MELILVLIDCETKNVLGHVNFNRHVGLTEQEAIEEVIESWDDFNRLEETELNPKSVDDFIEWHNEMWVSKIEEVIVSPTIDELKGYCQTMDSNVLVVNYESNN